MEATCKLTIKHSGNTYSEEIVKAYKKMIAASSKYDVEFKTPYGRKVMKQTYDTLCDLCIAEGLNIMAVCGDLVGDLD